MTVDGYAAAACCWALVCSATICGAIIQHDTRCGSNVSMSRLSLDFRGNKHEAYGDWIQLTSIFFLSVFSVKSLICASTLSLLHIVAFHRQLTNAKIGIDAKQVSSSHLHFGLDKLDPLFDVRLGFHLILLHQHGSDQLVDLVVLLELAKLSCHLFVFAQLRVELLPRFHRRLERCQKSSRNAQPTTLDW